MEFQQYEFAVIAPQSWPDMLNSEDLEQFYLCVTVRPFRTVFFSFSGCVQLWQVSKKLDVAQSRICSSAQSIIAKI